MSESQSDCGWAEAVCLYVSNSQINSSCLAKVFSDAPRQGSRVKVARRNIAIYDTGELRLRS